VNVFHKKVISLGTVSALYSVLFFLIAALLMSDPDGISLPFIAIFAGAALVWCALMSCVMAFMADNAALGAVMALVAALPLVLISRSLPGIVGAIMVMITLIVSRSLFAYEVNSRVAFSTRSIFWRGTKIVILGLSIALTALAFPLVKNGVQSGNIVLPVSYVASVTKPLTPLLSNYFPGYSSTSTVDQIIAAQIAEQVKDLPPGFTVDSGQTERIKADLGRRLGVDLRGNETVAVIVANYVNNYVQKLAEGDGVVMIAVLIVITLLALRAVIPVLAWPTLAIIAAIIYLAQRIGLIVVLRTQVTIERMRL